MYTILLLDDESKHLFTIRDYLKCNGFNVFVSNSPLKALDLVMEVNPDLLVVDIMMPQMTGYSFIKQLKSSIPLAKIPFIFLSAKGLTQDRVIAYKMGCSGYISKPFDPDELLALIFNILKRDQYREKEIVQTIKQLQKIRFYLEQQYYLFDLNFKNLVLTPQENKILNYVIKGFRNKEIACTLKISVRNVEKYIARLLNKTNTKSRIDLIRFIYLNNFSLPFEK